jgi:hypothetical protein
LITSTLISLAADFCGDPNQTRYTPAKYLSSVNLAQNQFAQDSMALIEDEPFTSVAETATVDLPSDFMVEESVIYDGLPLKPVTRHTLAILYPDSDWTLLTGVPTLYMVDPEEANKKLRFIPIPEEAATGSLRYYPLPSAVVSDSDVVLNSSTLMSRFHLAIAAFTAWLNLMGETPTQEIVEKRRDLMRIYSDGVAKAADSYGNTKSEQLRIRPK